MRAVALAAPLSLATLGGVLAGQEGCLRVKAALASRLIERSFEAHLADGRPHRPWRWADTHPIASLELPRLGLRRIVLEGASGASLAFGPGHLDGTAAPNAGGTSVIAGHRDGDFACLAQLRPGDEVRLRTPGALVRYAVVATAVVGDRDGSLLEPVAPPSRRLVLVTCWPFGGLTRSRWRYVVICEPRRAGRAAPPAARRSMLGRGPIEEEAP